MQVTVLLQARTNSSRLPAKVLLPVGKMPLVVLAAKRASNQGLHTVVVTSDEASDDLLSAELERWNVPFFRGSLNDTLSRFVQALAARDDEHVVVRLTGDNVFPDGELIAEMLADFCQADIPYLCCMGESSGLPYGVSVEITKLGLLRRIHEAVSTDEEREHVTLGVVRQFGRNFFSKYHYLRMSHFRCTVDTLDDYLRIGTLFQSVDDPVTEPFLHLVDRLRTSPGAPLTDRAVSKMVLGTAQLGMNYGVANITGTPTFYEAKNIIRTAVANGVAWIDTARAYGNSEAVVGASLHGARSSGAKVITKLSPLTSCPKTCSADVVKAFVSESVYRSCVELSQDYLDVLLLHRADHLSEWNGEAWNCLNQLREDGKIKSLGVSVQNTTEMLLALENEQVEYIQLPFNLLDKRWLSCVDKIRDIRRTRNIVIHVRSVFLQGLLISDDPEIWRRTGCHNFSEIIQWMDDLVLELGVRDRVDLCLTYARSHDWIDGVVIGTESMEQLKCNIEMFGTDLMATEQLQTIDATRPLISEKVLDPANWL